MFRFLFSFSLFLVTFVISVKNVKTGNNIFTFLPKKKRVKNTSETVAAFSLYIHDFEYEKRFSVKRIPGQKFGILYILII